MFCTDVKHFASAESQGAIAHLLWSPSMMMPKPHTIFMSFDQLILEVFEANAAWPFCTLQPYHFFLLIKHINNILVCAAKATIYEHVRLFLHSFFIHIDLFALDVYLESFSLLYLFLCVLLCVSYQFYAAHTWMQAIELLVLRWFTNHNYWPIHAIEILMRGKSSTINKR